MSITYLFHIILAILIPFLLFILPILFNMVNYNWWVPKDFIISIIISLIVGIIFIIYHTQNTNEQCKMTNTGQAILTGLKAMLLVFLSLTALDYFPAILEPFSSVFFLENELAMIVYKSVILYSIVFLYLTSVGFSSIKNTCKADIERVKQVYKQLEAEIK